VEDQQPEAPTSPMHLICAWYGAETDATRPFAYPTTHASLTVYTCSEAHQRALREALD
jgi:hypothetical protein